MKCEFDEKNDILKFKLDEDIDMEACKTIREIIDGYIIKHSPRECVIDMKNVKFMDSSGLGLIMGRYNLMKMLNGKMTLINPCQSIKKILDMTDFTKDIKIV